MEFSKTLVFLHGGPGYPDYLRDYFEHEFNWNVECVFYTQAHGPEVSIVKLLEELHEKLDGRREPYLIGHSWGGVLAQQYLKAYPDTKINGLILISSFLDYEELDVAYKSKLLQLGLTRPTLSKVFYTDKESAQAQAIQEKVRHFDYGFFQKLHHEFLDSFHGNEFFRSIQCPILNIFGTHDVRTPPELLRTFADLNPQVKNIEVYGAGHFPFILSEPREKIINSINNSIGDFRFRTYSANSDMHVR